MQHQQSATAAVFELQACAMCHDENCASVPGRAEARADAQNDLRALGSSWLDL